MKTYRSQSAPPAAHEITPEHVYLNRRQFMKLGAAAVSLAALAACAPLGSNAGPTLNAATPSANEITPTPTMLPDTLTDFEAITNYNNFYEYSVDKQAVAQLSKDLRTSPWTVEVGGLVTNPKTYGVEDLTHLFPPEERIYRLRCVEAWSMVIPWLGFPLASLLKAVEPTGDAKYVRFVTLMDPSQMPGESDPSYPWPYQEGLRLDEAMHPLTILSTGLYGKALLPQNGAPIRLVVPWKYGFKSIKSIIKIELVAEQPATLWSSIAPNEYGFYANVNPDVPHPRWSQASERRIGELTRRPTYLFNGYAADVAGLYAGMDLKKEY
ncbi:sulfite oxidase [Longilinea arvoryzae]|uniref:Protein-methionine-sulfoxide reductase catalytic subunit MsrP n=1 Tax=Longilinea arvoryzae TaxID=360412 RepID=A0A0K8MXE2_9CHLR|nr:protein-methionine-sulfoxide reductase catalytic subunit MsrP [Longilinea arvoryzae]GAP15928.1 sulfite oxidase [Longilinea arvoryzae]